MLLVAEAFQALRGAETGGLRHGDDGAAPVRTLEVVGVGDETLSLVGGDGGNGGEHQGRSGGDERSELHGGGM